MIGLALIASLAGLQTVNRALLLDASRENQGGWVCVHLKGTPAQIGYQHGYLLAPEIDDCVRLLRFETNGSKPGTSARYLSTRKEIHRIFWQKVPPALRREIEGIASGLHARGYSYTADDILYLNAEPEWSYRSSKTEPGDHCSAFVATGSATRDGKIVMGHSFWSSFPSGERWNAILDIAPKGGQRFVMDAMPGLVDSGSDFAINSAGLLLCETTISGFKGFDDNGIPEFVRMRMAVQHAKTLDDMVRILRVGNNGGYANTWLIGDTGANEIGKLELGLKNVILHRTSDGAFYGANYPEDEKLIAEECPTYSPSTSSSGSDRRKRWQVLISQNRGKIDANLAMKFLGDHHDEARGIDRPCISTLCGHVDNEDRASHAGPFLFAPSGATQAKVTTAALAKTLTFWARMGRPCGEPFLVGPYLEAHPEYAALKPVLRDMPSRPWILFRPLEAKRATPQK